MKTAKLLRRLAKARTEASELYNNTAQLRSLALTVANVLEEREQKGHLNSAATGQQNVEETLISIKNSIDSCKRAVSIIHRAVSPLTQESERMWIQRVKYVWSSTSIIQGQEKLILLHLQLLGVSLQILNSLDQASMMQMMRSALDYSSKLLGTARQEESVVVDLEASRESASVESVNAAETDEPQDEDTQLGEAFEDAGEDDVLQRKCSEYLLSNATTLAVAVRRQDADEVRRQIDAGANMTVRDEQGRTLLHHASYRLDVPTLECLLSYSEGRNPDFLDAAAKRGETALMLIATQADDSASYSAAEMLLRKGCNVNEVNYGEPDRDALYYALERSKGDNQQNHVRFINLLADYDVSTARVEPYFSRELKRYPNLRRREDEDAVQDDDDTDPHRKESLIKKAKRKFSISRSAAAKDTEKEETISTHS